MKPLIAIKSCGRDAANGFNQAIRDTWKKDARCDSYFFLGRTGSPQHADEVVLDCPDDYRGLPYKTKAICEWAWNKDYTHVFLCDTDTFVSPEKLLDSGFENYDYVGHFNSPRGIPNAVYGKCYSWASGGSGYWLSREAMKLVADSDQDSTCPVSGVPCEDLLVGQVLGPLIAQNAIIVSHDPRYSGEIARHYLSQSAERSFDPAWMYQQYSGRVNK